MKRIFVYCFAMFLAVGLVTSCGKKGAGELAKELTTVIKTATDGLKKAETGEDVIAVINKLVDDEAAVVDNYPEDAKQDFMMMNEDEFISAHPNEGPAYFEAHKDLVNTLYKVEELVDEVERQQMWKKRHTTKVI